MNSVAPKHTKAVSFTPGEWRSEPCGIMRPNERLIVAHLGKLPNGIEEISTIGRVFETVYTEANARLIACAPELLEACRQRITEWHSNMRNFDRKEPESLTMMRAAIKKAERGA